MLGTVLDTSFLQTDKLLLNQFTHFLIADGDLQPQSEETESYACDTCGRSFSQKGNLSRHQLVHTKERPFRCEICGKSFSLKYNFRTHYYTVHKGSKKPWPVVD